MKKYSLKLKTLRSNLAFRFAAALLTSRNRQPLKTIEVVCDGRALRSIALVPMNVRKSTALKRAAFYHAMADHYLFKRWHWKAGQSALYRMQTPMRYAPDLPQTQGELVRDLDARLDAWLRAQPNGAPNSSAVPNPEKR